MTMAPLLNDNYYVDGGNNDVKNMMEEAYTQALTINQAFWAEADIDARFKAGDQQLWNDLYGNMPAMRKQTFNFNRIRRIVNMITGHQRKNRKSMTVIPIENSDEVTANQLSKTLFWAVRRDNVLETISEAFEGAVTTGMSLLSCWMDYRHDSVNGDVCVDNVPYNGYLIDPFFRKTDLTDCNFVWRRMWKSKKQLKAIFPGREEEIDGINPRGNRDGKFQFMAESYNYSMTNLIAFDEYWYVDTRKQKIVEDVETGDTMEYYGTDEDLEEFLALDDNRIARDHYIPTVRLVYMVDNRVFYDGPNPYGHEMRPMDRYPFVPVFAYYEPDLPYFPWRVQGVVRGLRDSQFLYNRRKVIELDILESQVNSGWVYKEDSLVDPNDVFFTGQGKGLALKAEAEMTDVQRINAPVIPPTMMQLSQALGDEIMQISGVNEELLGSADDDKAGILSMLRQGAGLTTLQKLYDQLDMSQKLLGNVMLDMIQCNFRPGKIQRIIEEEPSPQFRNKSFMRYDSEVEDGLNTATQRQMQFAQMLHLRETGLPITAEMLVEASTLVDKKDMVEKLKKIEEQQTQQQQKQEEMQLSVLKAQIEDLKSSAAGYQSLALERISRISESESLSDARHAQAIEDLQDAKLAKAKTMREISELDLNQIERLLDITKRLQDETVEESNQVGLKAAGMEEKVEALDTMRASFSALGSEI